MVNKVEYILNEFFFVLKYTVFHKKTPFVFFVIHSNDDQFIQNFYQLWLKK